MEEDFTYIASFDIGKKAFAFCVEKINIKNFENMNNISKINRYNKNGTPSKEFQKLLNNVYREGELVLLKVVDLTINCKKKSYIDPETYYNMNEVLNNYQEYWDKCSVFVIEQQMGFNKNRNTMAIKLGQHCFSYFVTTYDRFKQTIEFPAYHKTNILGAEKIEKKTKGGKVSYKSVNKPARKKWCVEMAKSILFDRDDLKNMAVICGAKKKDDLADVICQLQAFKYLAFIDNLK